VNIQYLQRAARSAERLGLIVEDLEAISKLETGELLLDQRMFDIYELMKDVYDSSELKSKAKNISLTFRKGSERPFYVYADKERIRQVVVNLIINSIKYGKEGGTTTTAIYSKDDIVRVEISDNGIGIEPRHVSRFLNASTASTRAVHAKPEAPDWGSLSSNTSSKHTARKLP
jgi:two-component system phosphate regulon sensor histidine kinase PhoR